MGISSKKAERFNETIAFIDESGFFLTPTFQRTWAPEGETPHVETYSSTDPVAVISALTYTPETDECELYFRSQQDHFDGDDIFAFFRDVTEYLPRDVMFILDNLPAHFPAVAQLREEFAETATCRCRVAPHLRTRTQSDRICLERHQIRRFSKLCAERNRYSRNTS